MPQRTVGILRDDGGGQHRAEAAGELLQRGADRAEGAALARLRDCRDQRLRRDHARKDADEHQHIDRDRGGQADMAEMGVDQHHDDRQRGAEREGRKFAEAVAGAADQRADDDAEQSGDQIDRRQMHDVDADIVDGVGAAERHQHVAAGRQQRRHDERQPVARLADGAIRCAKRVTVLLQR